MFDSVDNRKEKFGKLIEGVAKKGNFDQNEQSVKRLLDNTAKFNGSKT